MNSDASRTALLCLVERGHEIISTTTSRECIVYEIREKHALLQEKMDEICIFSSNMQCYSLCSGFGSALIWLKEDLDPDAMKLGKSNTFCTDPDP
jgi:hypothetical protein